MKGRWLAVIVRNVKLLYHPSNIQLEQYNFEVAAEDILQYIV